MSPSIARTAGATVGALAVLGLTAGALWAGSALPEPDTGSAEPWAVRLPATDSTAVCAPLPVPTTEDTGPADPEQDQGDRTVRSSLLLHTWPTDGSPAAAATWAPDSGAGEAVDLDTVAARDTEVRSLVAEAGDPGVLTVAPVEEDEGGTVGGAEVPVAGTGGGAMVVRTDAGDLRGLAAQTCQAPSSSTWLVGGSTELGSTALLTLTNPGAVPVQVDVTVHTSRGVVDAPALSDVVVPPRESVQLPVEASVEDEALALHVTGDGGPVAASLQDLRTQGLVSAGLDLVGPSAPPEQTQVVGGVGVVDGERSHVRIANPGEETVTAAIDLGTADGWRELGGAEDVEIEAGAVVDVPLTGVDPGVHAVRVRAEGPVVAAAVVAQEGSAPEGSGDTALDLAWTGAGVPRTDAVHVLPAADLGVQARVAVTNPSEVTQVVTLTDLVGTATDTVEVAPGATVVVGAPAGASAVRVTAEDVGASEDDGETQVGGESPSDAETPSGGESPSDDAEAPSEGFAVETPSAGAESATAGPEASGSAGAEGQGGASPDPGVVSVVLLDAEVPTGRLVATLVPSPDPRESAEVDVLVR